MSDQHQMQPDGNSPVLQVDAEQPGGSSVTCSPHTAASPYTGPVFTLDSKAVLFLFDPALTGPLQWADASGGASAAGKLTSSAGSAGSPGGIEAAGTATHSYHPVYAALIKGLPMPIDGLSYLVEVVCPPAGAKGWPQPESGLGARTQAGSGAEYGKQSSTSARFKQGTRKSRPGSAAASATDAQASIKMSGKSVAGAVVRVLGYVDSYARAYLLDAPLLVPPDGMADMVVVTGESVPLPESRVSRLVRNLAVQAGKIFSSQSRKAPSNKQIQGLQASQARQNQDQPQGQDQAAGQVSGQAQGRLQDQAQGQGQDKPQDQSPASMPVPVGIPANMRRFSLQPAQIYLRSEDRSTQWPVASVYLDNSGGTQATTKLSFVSSRAKVPLPARTLPVDQALAYALIPFALHPMLAGVNMGMTDVGAVLAGITNGDLFTRVHALLDTIATAKRHPVLEPPALLLYLAHQLRATGIATASLFDIAAEWAPSMHFLDMAWKPSASAGTQAEPFSGVAAGRAPYESAASHPETVNASGQPLPSVELMRAGTPLGQFTIMYDSGQLSDHGEHMVLEVESILRRAQKLNAFLEGLASEYGSFAASALDTQGGIAELDRWLTDNILTATSTAAEAFQGLVDGTSYDPDSSIVTDRQGALRPGQPLVPLSQEILDRSDGAPEDLLVKDSDLQMRLNFARCVCDLALPYRMSHRFRMGLNRGEICLYVDASCPDASIMPRDGYDPDTRAWSMLEHRELLASELRYAAHTAILLAGLAFWACPPVQHVVVNTWHDRQPGEAAGAAHLMGSTCTMSVNFERSLFVDKIRAGGAQFRAGKAWEPDYSREPIAFITSFEHSCPYDEDFRFRGTTPLGSLEDVVQLHDSVHQSQPVQPSELDWLTDPAAEEEANEIRAMFDQVLESARAQKAELEAIFANAAPDAEDTDGGAGAPTAASTPDGQERPGGQGAPEADQDTRPDKPDVPGSDATGADSATAESGAADATGADADPETSFLMGAGVETDYRALDRAGAALLAADRIEDMHVYERSERVKLATRLMYGLRQGTSQALKDLSTAHDRTENPLLRNVLNVARSQILDGSMGPADTGSLRDLVLDQYGLRPLLRQGNKLLNARQPAGACEIYEKIVSTVIDQDWFADTDTRVYRYFDSYASRALYAGRCHEDLAGRELHLVADEYYQALQRLAVLYMNSSNRTEDAITIAQKIVQLGPSVSSSYSALARSYFCVFDYRSEIEAFKQLLRVSWNPAHVAAALYGMGYAYWMLDQEELGTACYQMAVYYEPDLMDMTKKELGSFLSKRGVVNIEETFLSTDDARRVLHYGGVHLSDVVRNARFLVNAADAALRAGSCPLAVNLLGSATTIIGDEALLLVIDSLGT